MPPSSTDGEPQPAEAQMPQAAKPLGAAGRQQPALEASLSGAKRKEMEPERKKTSFKVVGQMVLAMKRFSHALNPTYSYGKKTTSSGSGSRPVSRQGTVDEKEVASSARPSSPGDDKYAYPDHGHRFDFLLKPLPPTEEEEAELSKRS